MDFKALFLLSVMLLLSSLSLYLGARHTKLSTNLLISLMKQKIKKTNKHTAMLTSAAHIVRGVRLQDKLLSLRKNLMSYNL